MSLMGWSSGSMAARYQHVTDAMRSEVASQVGELIWTPAADARKDRLTVRPEELAVLLAAARDCLARHEDPNDRAELRAALAELDASLAAAAVPSGTPTETKLRQREVGDHEQEPAALHRAWSGWRRMGDSNPRGLAPNTLSNNVARCSPLAATVRDLRGCAACGRR
jgi:hypothetical protein